MTIYQNSLTTLLTITCITSLMTHHASCTRSLQANPHNTTHPYSRRSLQTTPDITTSQIHPKLIYPSTPTYQQNQQYTYKPPFCSMINTRPPKIPSQPPQTRQILVPTNYGFSMYVDSKDFDVSRMIRQTGTWEPQLLNLIGHIVKPGDWVLNLGSQSGLEAVVMGKIVGPGGRLFVVEPYSFSNYLVRRNLEVNGLGGIATVYRFGASDRKGVGKMTISYTNTGASQIKQLLSDNPNPEPQTTTFPSGQTETVPTDTVDNQLPAGTTLNFALIDVQKMQVKALTGMKTLIRNSPHLIIMTEWQYSINPDRDEGQTRELLLWLEGLGYRAYEYFGGDYMLCRVGYFRQFGSLGDVMGVQLYGDVFFFPRGVDLPR